MTDLGIGPPAVQEWAGFAIGLKMSTRRSACLPALLGRGGSGRSDRFPGGIVDDRKARATRCDADFQKLAGRRISWVAVGPLSEELKRRPEMLPQQVDFGLCQHPRFFRGSELPTG